MTDDLLASGTWWCAAAERDLGPTDLAPLSWLPAVVPGTAAGAVRTAQGLLAALERSYDAQDWWWRCTVTVVAAGPYDLELDGLATIAEVWLDGQQVLTSASMFARHRLRVDLTEGTSELLVVCRALAPRVKDSRPRARWRTRLVTAQGLRRWRTSLLGRVPTWYGATPAVGPWRPVRLVSARQLRVVRSVLSATVAPSRAQDPRRPSGTSGEQLQGTVGVDVGLAGPHPPQDVALGVVGPGSRVVAQVRGDVHVAGDGTWRVTAVVPVHDVRLWWPHTHGDQPLYDVQIDVDGQRLAVGRVGFRAVQAERGDGGFALRVNGSRVFCRGACWVPPDCVGLAADRAMVEAELLRLRDAGLNMVRVTGTTTWQGRDFWDCCDELGLLVWQDCMLATLDPPDDDDFLAAFGSEVRQELTDLAGRPSLAVVSGGSETEQQPTYAGLPAERRTMPVLSELLPALVAEVVPGVPFVTSTPTGGDLPTHVGAGVAHYFGVGAYLRAPELLRRDDVRFAAECLAFATPPERAAVEEWFAGPAVAGHDPQWKRAVPRDPGAAWDFEDVTQHYVRTIFGVDPVALRRTDPDRALDLSRAVVAHLVRETLSEWRRPASRCAGAIVLQSRDLARGAGWGLLDAAGRPKSSWFALRDVAAPRVLLVTDEGLDGLAVHLVNDSPEPMTGRLVVDVLDRAGRSALDVEREVEVAAGQGRTWSVDGLLGVFRDLTHAHRFGPVQYDAVVARFVASGGGDPIERVHVIDSTLRGEPCEVGLSAQAYQDVQGAWWLRVQTDRLARWVSIDVAGFEVSQSWFHLAPHHPRTLALRPAGAEQPRGTVRAVGAVDVAAIEVVA
ncbi:MAG TPA: hypothetical protein VHO27_01135 [Angustibacter sp.]|nr:hypothetical protein [Angustibacter sp.]